MHQGNSLKSYNHFLALLRKALSEELLSHPSFKKTVCDIIHQEIRLSGSVLAEQGIYNSVKVSSKIGWLAGDQALLKFYALLITHGYIACDFENFKPHFVGQGQTHSHLIWLAHNKKLVYLFDQLIVNGLIPESKTSHLLLCEHFQDKKGNVLKRGSLRSSLNSARNNKSIQIIENIITELTKKS